MDRAYELKLEIPDLDDYLRLRQASGMTPRSAAAAAVGLPNTAVGVVVRHGPVAVGMGRVIGDGLCFQLVDIAVDPAHQGRGIGHAIVGSIMEALARLAPAEAYVSLIADLPADRLYARYGFRPTAPASIGMAQWIGRETGIAHD